ncbi:hypothetical protein [Alicyclobacillus sp.]|uniref:hypothetical protein n=1 Tax=Alicyclobacillus sp. TaxID=61169 RepID=UPI0025C4D0F7|nr:hypothetical protein [Alicyclobacillus sp.]MCL6516804.1 hypothetical protein [Alicyclobacillus sp.]
MRTLRSFEALEAAERYGVPVYDLVGKRELDVEEAHQLVQGGRDPSTFVLQRWPDSDEEAEQLVLKEFQRALKERRWAEASVFDLSNAISGGLAIHLEAAELAAERLAEQGKLQFVKSGQYKVYALPRTVRFSDAFLDKLRDQVCDACATLDLEGDFHEACLMNLLDFLREHTFGFDDIEEVPADAAGARAGRRGPGVGADWLRRTAELARTRFRGVIRARAGGASRGAAEARPTIPTGGEEMPVVGTGPNRTAGTGSGVGPGAGGAVGIGAGPGAGFASGTMAGAVSGTASGVASGSVSGTGAFTAEGSPGGVAAADRPQVTKRELIRYLQSVEILDENGEIDRLRQEREELMQRIAQRDKQLEKMQRDKAYFMKQFEEMQHDMDVLVQAMQIAKRREQRPAPVVDATFDEADD